MRRREFIGLLGGAVAWPLAAEAQQKLPIIGFLDSYTPVPPGPPELFRNGLKEVGYVEGQNVAFEYRSAMGHYDRLNALADELVRLHVSLIAAYGHPAAFAAKAATDTIPIVFWTGGDPVADGIVPSLSNPGGNATGLAMFNNVLGAKRLGLLQELLPNAANFAILVNPTNPNAESQLIDAQEAARVLGMQLRSLHASSDDEIDAAYATLVNQRIDGLLVASDPYLFARAKRLIELAAQYAVPTIYTVPSYAKAGGLISYASSESLLREFGNYAGRILSGSKPADLPIQQSTKFQLVINLKTAKTLGLVMPPTLLARADEVIE
jgi:putative ABC transport system substrate-binding protein